MFDFESATSAVASRRTLLKGVGLAGVSALSMSFLAGCGGSGNSHSSSNQDADILGAAKIAEALATTMYTAIINDAPFFGSLDSSNQDYIRAAQAEEKFHYDLLKGATGGADAQLNYYFPTGMFTDAQTTLDTLVTLEDAFVAAYLIGVKDLSSPDLRVLAAQIMGVESDHRTLARIIGDDLGLTSITGLSGSPESVDPPNNNVYERTYGLTDISQVVTALTPFLALGANTVQKTFNPTFSPSNSGLYPNPANG